MIKFWYTNARPTSLPQSILPSLVAVCLAISAADFSWGLALFAVVGVALGHLGLNLFDDYFDYKKKKSTYREELVHEGFRARIGKCPYLTSGRATLRELLIACLIFCALAVVCGAMLWWFRGIFVVYIAALAAVLGIFYSGPPLRLSYHGFGELLIGLIFGPLNMIGTYYAACGQVDSRIVLISVPVGLLVMNIVYVHSILDFTSDKKIGKRTLAVLLNNTTAMLVVLFGVIFVPFAIIAWGIFTGGLSAGYGFVFLTFPLAISLFYLMIEFVKHPQKKFLPKFWMGPMANWERMQQAGIDWFMIRWFSARNLLSFFCLIIVILSLCL
ncbi:1,4-dihydroxy-2-naphthoate octaprenyltransferase [Bacteroidia bacterium]|nr:1,4-dihydroxy-2-naphthoate octaprenyltransferase [Bacteroidia bacterium]